MPPVLPSAGTSTTSVDEAPPPDPEFLSEFIEHLTTHDDPSLSAVGYELEALESIYPGSLRLLPAQETPGSSRVPSRTGTPAPSASSSPHRIALPQPGERIRYELTLPGWEDEEAPRVRVLVTLPGGYPETTPQLQLLGRYVGSFPIDAGLFGDITRTYISSTGIPHTEGEVCIFDGLVYVQSLVQPWYAAHVAEDTAGEAARATERETAAFAESETSSASSAKPKNHPANANEYGGGSAVAALARLSLAPARPLPAITTSEPIVDRKSQFIGHAARITDESDVAAIVAHLLEDRRIARAAHPTIFAYRVIREVGGAAGRIAESDYDDDGETQAGARLKHLLEILELENVLVVVTRWFGGIHLGPDRFKHINQAARDALMDGGFLDEPQPKKKGKK